MAGIQIDGVNNKIDFDDDADTSISSATDDTLVIESGGVNIASITSGEFAINEGSANIDFRVESDSNANALHVDGGNSSVGINTTGASDATLQINDSVSIIKLLDTDDNSFSRVYHSAGSLFFDADKGNSVGSSKIQFGVDDTEKIRITGSGIHIGGTGDANALDDYEEGTWTPSGASLGVATNHKAIYRKIGDIVFLYCDITMDSSPADTAQATSLAGFPFTCNDDYFQCNSRVAGLNQTIEANIAGTGAVFRDKADGVVCTRSEFAGERCQHIFIYTIA